MVSSVSADVSWLPGPLLDSRAFDRSTIALTLLAIVILPVLASFLFGRNPDKPPVVNPPKLFQPATQKGEEFFHNGMGVVREGWERFGGKPFDVISNFGPITILSIERAHELRNNPTLTFRKVFGSELDHILPGFRNVAAGAHDSGVLPKVVAKYLTKRLNTVTFPLTQETTFAVAKALGDKTDWTEVPIYKLVQDMVARMSSRVFLGPEICRDEEWLGITKAFASAFLPAMLKIRLFPLVLRPLVYLFDPSCKAMARMTARAASIIDPIVASRRRERQECQAQGIPAPVYNDAIEWIESEAAAAGVSFTVADFQLSLSMAAINTTSDLLTWTLLWLASDPEGVQALRQEMLEVLPANGWKKTSLYNLKLLDSALKEAQRLKPSQKVSMLRRATQDTRLSDGLLVPKGHIVAVDTYSNLVNPARYEDPHRFDLYRFRKMREQPGCENKAQLVTTSPEHMTFGYGKYACPGRFFAANEVKVALCHLLLKYDWKLVPGTTIEARNFGFLSQVDYGAKLLCRRRREEINLESLEADDFADEVD